MDCWWAVHVIIIYVWWTEGFKKKETMLVENGLGRLVAFTECLCCPGEGEGKILELRSEVSDSVSQVTNSTPLTGIL